MSSSLMSASSASVLALITTTGACCRAATSRSRSRCGLFSKPSSATLATNIAGLAVMRQSGFSTASSSLLKAMERTGRAWSRAALHFSSTSTRRLASLSLPDLATLTERACVFSTVARSARQSSVWITSMSDTGSTLPATWITFSSSKQRTTLTIASVSRTWARNWLPRPSPLDAPATRPAMSTNSTIAGTMRSGLTIAASWPRRGSGSSTTPTFGSMVQKG